jgi:hypothetical protein
MKKALDVNLNIASLVAFVIGLHLTILFYTKFTAWPEMLAWPDLMVRGWLPYKDIAIAHTPFLVTVTAFIYYLFGVGVIQLKILTWTLILTTDIFLFYISTKLWNRRVAIFTLLTYIFLQSVFDGNGLWFDSVLTLESLVIFYLVFKKKYLLTGAAWGIAFFTKQTALWLALAIFLSVIYSDSKKRVESVINLASGAFIVFLLTIGALYLTGVLPQFIKWALWFGMLILPSSPGQMHFPTIKNISVIMFLFSPFLLMFIDKKIRKNSYLLFWGVCGALGMYPRFEYFHLQPAIPYIAMFAGIAYSHLSNKKKFLSMGMLLYTIGILYIFTGFFLRNINEGVRFYEQNVKNVTAYVKSKILPGEAIFIMNWWDNVYALTSTVPAANPLVPQLEWYQEIQGTQDEEIADLIASKPKLILLQPYSSIGLDSYIPKKLYEYVLLNYTTQDVVDGIEILVPNN